MDRLAALDQNARLAPVHPAARVGRGGAGDRRAGGGLRARRHRRQPLHRRRLVAVVHRPRPPPSAHRRRRARPARPGGALHHARPHPPLRPSSWPSGSPRSRRPASRACFYSDSGSTATEIALKMAFQFCQQRGEHRAATLHRPARRLPRGHDRLGVGRRDRPVPHDVPPAPVRHAEGRARRHRRHGAAVRGAPRRGGRGDHGAAGAGRRRDARAPRGLPARGARAVRPPRRAAHLRRGGGRASGAPAGCSPASTRAWRRT